MDLFDFNVILGVDNFLSALSCVTEMCAIVVLRFKHPEIERPYKVNVSSISLLVIMVIPFSIGTFVLLNELVKSRLSLLLNIVAILLGVGYHQILRRSASYVTSEQANKLLQYQLEGMERTKANECESTVASIRQIE